MTGLELICLSLTVYYEARSEPIVGQVAVAQVVMQRVEDSKYANNVCEVVYQGGDALFKCHFTWYCDGLPDDPADDGAWTLSLDIAKLVANGYRLAEIIGVLHYHSVEANPDAVWWAEDMIVVAKIGNHVFLTET